MTFVNAREGWQIWEEKLNQLDAPAGQILIGMEATSRYGENLYHELEQRGYVLRLLHPGQTHHFHQQRGLRAKTDRLDAMTIERRVVEWGGANGLCAKRASGYVSGIGALAYATLGYSRQLPKRDPGPDRGALPRIHAGLCRSLLAHCPLGAEPPSRVLRPWSKQGSNLFSNCYERSQQRITAALPHRNWWPWRSRA
jgi:Transposase